jgi:hypothetical protein
MIATKNMASGFGAESCGIGHSIPRYDGVESRFNADAF